MYVSIDLDNLVFVHKHHDMNVVSDLAYIELPHVSVYLTRVDFHGTLSGFTIFELNKLYRNTTGEPFADSYSIPALKKALAACADALPVTDCVPNEVRTVASAMKPGLQPYRYVKGSTRAAVNFNLTDHAMTLDGPPVTPYSYPALEPLPVMAPKMAEAQGPKSVRPPEGLALEIWTALDTMPQLRNGQAIQEYAQSKGWNTLTAIIQLSQWNKANPVQ